MGLGDIILPWTTFLVLGSLWRSVEKIKPISYVVSLNLENLLTLYPRQIYGMGWKR
jgi:hypothetical protein